MITRTGALAVAAAMAALAAAGIPPGVRRRGIRDRAERLAAADAQEPGSDPI